MAGRFAWALACFILATGPAAAANVPQGEADLRLHMSAAVDRDCDGVLQNETAADRGFATKQSLRPGQCLIYRTSYRNEGAFSIRHVRITNRIPPMMVFLAGSAQHVETPPGLSAETTLLPSPETEGALIWRFRGALEPGESGALEFRVRLEPFGAARTNAAR